MNLFFIVIAMICMMSQAFCAESIRTISWELVPKILNFSFEIDKYRIPLNTDKDQKYIDIKRILELRLICSTCNQTIIRTINNHLPWLESFYIFIENKNIAHILDERASFLNHFPNLRTHIPTHVSRAHLYLFSQNFSFCTNVQDYAILYEKQKKITFENLKSFDESNQKGYFIKGPVHALACGWFNHGYDIKECGRETNFAQIGFLFFDPDFSPLSEFWQEPYHPDTINPANVLISLSFHDFFQKAVYNFIKKIPECCKFEIIDPVMKMNPPMTDIGIDFGKYFQNYVKPVLEKRLNTDCIPQIKSVIEKILANTDQKKQTEIKPEPQKSSIIFTKLKVIFKKCKLQLHCIILIGLLVANIYIYFKLFKLLKIIRSRF